MNITLTGEGALTAQRAIQNARTMWPVLADIGDREILIFLTVAGLIKEEN